MNACFFVTYACSTKSLSGNKTLIREALMSHAGQG
jgi:hypothetical protein